jgi:hypothetical protein
MRVLADMSARVPLAVALAVAFVVACSQSSGTSETPPPASAPAMAAAPAPLDPSPAAEAPATKRPVIATIVTNDAKVSIVGHGGDLRVVVKKADGTLVADGMTLDDLAKRDPEAYRLVKNATAGVERGDFVDATYRAPPTSPGARGGFDATLDR